MPDRTSTDDPRSSPEQRRARSSGQEASGPPLVPLRDDEHLLEPIITRAEQDPFRVVAAYRQGPAFVDVTAAEFLERVRAIAKGLIASGVQVGDRVAIMSRTRLEWVLADYAILAVGAATVSIYETSAAAQVKHIIVDSEAILALVENDEMSATVDAIGEESACREVLVIDAGGIDELTTRGQGVPDSQLDDRIDALTLDDTATIIYTSGTTGQPKGCVLTHGNLRSNVKQNLDIAAEMLGPDERSLFFLPLAHSYAKIIVLLAAEHGIEAAFASDMANLVEEMAMTKPTVIVGVPRVFEKVFMAAQQRSHAQRRGWIFDRAVATAVRFSRERNLGVPRPWTRLEHALFDRLVYGKIRGAFGGSLRISFSGGSPLGERLTYFFDGVGVRIFEGYGLTETSPILTVNRLDAWRPGTVGRPVAGTTLCIAEDGEILVSGPQVFEGYWGREEETREVLTDEGWFRTGDIGELEDDFLRIVGRKKDLIVTAGGKNVAPEPMQDRLRAHPLISQAVVIGNNRPFIAALVTLDEEAFQSWQARHHRDDQAQEQEGAQTLEGASGDLDLRAEIQEAVDDANSLVSRAESIRAFTILPSDLTVERQELTPTMKIRRATVEQHYADEIDRLYQR